MIFSPLTLCHTSRDPHPQNYLSIVRGDFCPEVLSFVFCLEYFVHGGFYICYNRKLYITLNFMFHIYDKKIISVMSHALDPSSLCHKLLHLLGPPPPRA